MSDQLHRLLAQAAELRAAGNSWDAIAAKLGRSAFTCRRLPVRYPRPWDRLFRRAVRSLLSEAGGEVLFYLRRLLRGELNKLGQDAAQFLYAKFLYAKELEWLDRAQRRMRRAAPSLPERPRAERENSMAFLARISDEEFDKLMGELNDRLAVGPGCGGGIPAVPWREVDPSGHGELAPSSDAETP